MTAPFMTKIDSEGIAELKFDLPSEKVNKFSIPVLNALEEELDSLAKNKSIKVLKLISGKEGIFIAGADLHSFEPAFEDPSIAKTIIETGHRVFNKLENMPFPTVAVIDGACLGGGLECALSCTYRVVSDNPKTQLGLPEVTLQIIPGWGGTQRLPRLMGLSGGLQMILSGKSIPAIKAWKSGLADALAPSQFLSSYVDQFVASILTKDGKKDVLKKRKKKGFRELLLEENPMGRAFLFYNAEKTVLEKTKGHYSAPSIALDLVKRTYTLPLEEGLKEEKKTFINNIPEGFRLAPDFIRLFFTQEAIKKETGAPIDTKTLPIQKVGIIGAGTMGATIAWLLADHNITTRLKDISWDIVGKGMGVAAALFKKGVKAKKVKPYEASRRFQLLSGTIDNSGFQHADLIIEAATENLELKQKIFRDLEEHIPEKTIIASNTSSLTIESMSASLKHPERLIGMHFFNPVSKMPLVEIVAGKRSSPVAIASAVELARKLGKTPIVVGDCPGFLVNRIFVIGANEVMLMAEEGFSSPELSKAILDFGMPMDPFELADEVGIDVTYKVCEVFEKAYGERMRPAKLLKLMVEKGFLGKKSGRGFYIYKGEKKCPNPAISPLIESIGRKRETHSEEKMVPRFLYGMINEAARCLEEKVIARPDYLDLALIMGIGFPPFRGGLLRYADQVGTAHIVKTLKEFAEKEGPRFQPCNLLEEMGSKNKGFY